MSRLTAAPAFSGDAADQAGRVGLARQRDHRGDRGPHPGPGDQHRRATHGGADQRDPGDAAAAQLGHGGGDVVDHPAPGVALRAGRPPKAAQVDGEGAQASPLGQVVGKRPEAAQVGRVLVHQHDPGRAAADHDPVEAGPVGRLEAEQGRPGVGGPQRALGCSNGCSAAVAVLVVWAPALRGVAARPPGLVGPEQAVATSAVAVRAAVIQRPHPRWFGGCTSGGMTVLRQEVEVIDRTLAPFGTDMRGCLPVPGDCPVTLVGEVLVAVHDPLQRRQLPEVTGHLA